MDDEADALDEWEFAHENGVPDYGEGGDGDGEERRVPAFYGVGGEIEGYEALELLGGGEGGGGHGGLPAYDAHPAFQTFS